MALSRDSERQALQDAADATLLKAAAEQQAAERNAELKSLGKAAEARAGEIAKNQWHLPTTGYHLTARFGMAGGLWSSNHTGLDFATASGTPIVAVANGVITETGYAGAYGNQTIETLDDGTEIWYCHQTAIGVKVGDTRDRRPADRLGRQHRQHHRPPPAPRGPPRRRRPGRPLPGPGLPRRHAVTPAASARPSESSRRRASRSACYSFSTGA